MQHYGPPQFLRSDHGSEFTARAVQQWLHDQQVGPSFITPGHPWQNGFIESFHGKFRDECLNREWFTTGYEATIVIEHWRKDYNTQRPHSALGYRTPAQMVALSTEQPGATLICPGTKKGSRSMGFSFGQSSPDTLLGHGQPAHAHTTEREKRVPNRGGNRTNRRFSNSRRLAMGSLQDDGFDFGSLHRCEEQIVSKVSGCQATVLDHEFLNERAARAHDDASLDLRTHLVGIDGATAVHRCHDAMESDLPRCRVERYLSDLGND
jgi:hypothetical protein